MASNVGNKGVKRASSKVTHAKEQGFAGGKDNGWRGTPVTPVANPTKVAMDYLGSLVLDATVAGPRRDWAAKMILMGVVTKEVKANAKSREAKAALKLRGVEAKDKEKAKKEKGAAPAKGQKKQAQQDAADTAGHGTEWGNDL